MRGFGGIVSSEGQRHSPFSPLINARIEDTWSILITTLTVSSHVSRILQRRERGLRFSNGPIPRPRLALTLPLCSGVTLGVPNDALRSCLAVLSCAGMYDLECRTCLQNGGCCEMSCDCYTPFANGSAKQKRKSLHSSPMGKRYKDVPEYGFQKKTAIYWPYVW